MPQADWSDEVAQRIGQRLRRYRDARGMSAQKVADACLELGVPIDRNVLASLENRRRNIVTVAEVMALARVLGVSPLALIFPVGDEDSIDVLPGVVSDPFAAAQWFAGESPFPGDPDSTVDPDALTLYRSHARIASDLLQQLRITQRLLNSPTATPGEVKAAQDATRARADALRAERLAIRHLGVRVPPLPDAIGSVVEIDEDDEEMYLDSEPDGDGGPSAADVLRQLLANPDAAVKQAVEEQIKGMMRPRRDGSR